MDEVVYRGQGGVVHRNFVYTKDEADEMGQGYLLDWRQASYIGQWVLTDDNYVVKVLNVGRRDGKLIWIRTCTGSFTWAQKLTTEERECRWTFNGKKRQGRDTHATEAFARLVALGMDYFKAYLATHPRSKNMRKARERADKLLQRERTQKLLSMEIDKLLGGIGVDKEWVLRRWKGLAEDADKDSVRATALKELSKYVGLEEEAKGGKQPMIGLQMLEAMQQVGQLAATAAGPAEEPAKAEIVEDKG